MNTVDYRLFSPVRPPRVRSLSKPSLSLSALAAYEKCRQRECELRRRDRCIFSAGIVMILAVLILLPLAGIWFRHTLHTRPFQTADVAPLLTVEGGLLGLTLLLALFTRKQSRADLANVFLDSGNRPVANDNPLVRWVLILILLGLLYGEFLVIDAIKSAWLNHRLRHVDRHRSTIILAKLFADPTGVDPRLLLQPGESPLHLRQTIAYLIANDWADISPHGDRLTLVSPARRALREYSVHG